MYQSVQKNPGDLRGKKVAIDTSVSLYQFLTEQPGKEAKNGIDTSYLLGMFERVSSLLKKHDLTLQKPSVEILLFVPKEIIIWFLSHTF